MIPFERAEMDGTLAGRFRRVVQAVPEHEALVDGDERLTYAALDAASDRVAAALADVPPDRPVGLYFGIGVDAVVALLGALKAGVPAIPIDPVAPPEGLVDLFGQVDRVLTDRQHAAACRDRAGATPVHEMPLAPAAAAPRTPDPRAPAVIYMTSASSGPSKGVLRTNRSLCWHASLQARHHGFGPGDRITHVSSFAFAGSVPAIFGGLMSGATVEAFDIRKHGSTALARWAEAHRITVLQVTATAMRDVVESQAQNRTGWQPRRIVISSEVLRRTDIAAIRERIGWTSCVVINRLASSEAGMITEWEIEPGRLQDDGSIPVGWPVEERIVTIVDEAGQPVPAGEAGEIVVGGDYTAIGYWNRPDLTAEKFRPDPDRPGCLRVFSGDLGRLMPDGMLEYLGRADQMVKVRGFRVELPAVEAALRAQPGVSEAVVLATPTRTGDLRLSAWVQREPGADVSGLGLRRALTVNLPDYMVPWRVGVFDDLPRTAGGKIARSAMPSLAGPRPEGLPPAVPVVTETEEMLVRIWSDLFEVDEIGREDDFLEMGGDSIDMVHVAACLYEERSVFITDSELFEHPKLADMAVAIDRSAAEE